MRFALVISFFIHALVFCSLPRFHSALKTTEKTPPEKTPPIEVVQLATPVPRATHFAHVTDRAARATTHAAGRATAPASKFGNLALSPKHVSLAAISRPQFDVDGVPVDDPTSAWGSGGADFSRVRDLGKFDRLYDLIDGHVMYPSVLAYHQIEGTVNARLILSSTGECDWHHSTISSTQSHLRLYVLDVLKNVCSRDLSRFARKDANSNLDLSFKFEITEHDDAALIAREKKVVGNVFLFYRNSQQSVAEWHVGPFRGMFPVPYVALDFSWLQENYDRVVHSRDPLREFKDHLGDI